MSITTLTVAASSIRGFDVETRDRVTESESGVIQSTTSAAARWRGTLVFDNLIGANRAAVEAAYFGMQGYRNQLRVAADTIWNYTPRGSGANTPVINGAHSAGAVQLAVDNATLSTAGLWLAGDFIQVGEELKIVLNDYDSDGAGEDTISIWPPLHNDLSGGEAIDDVSPSGVFFVVGGSGITRIPFPSEINPSISLDLVEDVTA